MHYDKVADFISLTTEIVPELLSISEKAQLVMNLRARVRNSFSYFVNKHRLSMIYTFFPKPSTAIVKLWIFVFPLLLPLQLLLELCRGDAINNLHSIQKQLEQIHACGAELNSTEHTVRKQTNLRWAPQRKD